MPTRLGATRSSLGDVLIYDRGVSATTDPIRLHLDTQHQNARGAKDFAIDQAYLPTAPGTQGGVTLTEWEWANGSGGAGTTIETPESYAAGACDYGEFAWLRRLGVAQPSGKLTEIALPVGSAAATGRFWHGRVFNGDLFITTNTRYVVKVEDASGTGTISEVDFGSGSHSTGIAIFGGKLYVGDVSGGIQEYDGTSWTEGAVGTERGFLEVPYWTLGDALAGAAGAAGSSAHHLVGTNAAGTGFYHCSGDPKVALNWTALTTVGTGGAFYPIASTVANNRTVFFGCGNGIFAADSLGYTPNLTKWVELNANGTFTAVWAAWWNDLVWFTTAQGLAAFDPSGRRIDLARTFRFGAESGISPIYGAIQVLAPSEDGLYVGLYNSVTNISYVGILLMDEAGRFRWSMAETVLPGEIVTYIQQVPDSTGVPRLFIGTIGSGNLMHLYVQDLPKSGDPEADYKSGGAFRAATAWNLTLSRFNGGQAVKKTARRYMLEAGQLGSTFADNQVEFEVSNDGGAYALQGTARGTSVRQGRWSAQPTANTAQATSYQVRLDVTNTATAPVVIRTAQVLYSSHPELSRSLSFPVVIGEGRPGEDPRAMLQRLEIAQRAGPLAMDDFFGRRIEGTISIDRARIVPEAVGNGYTVHADVTILVTRRVSRFDAGDLYDTGATFS